MLAILMNRINTVKEIIACLEEQIERELSDDFFGINEVLIQDLKNKVTSKLIDYNALVDEFEMDNLQRKAA